MGSTALVVSLALLLGCGLAAFGLSGARSEAGAIRGDGYVLMPDDTGWSGSLGAHRIEVHATRRPGAWRVRVGISTLPAGLRVAPRTTCPTGRSTGDPTFDATFRYTGSELALGWLCASHHLLLLGIPRCEIADRTLEGDIPDPTTPAGAEALGGVVRLAERLAATGPERTLRRMADEDLPAVRERALLALSPEGRALPDGTEPVAGPVLDAALGDAIQQGDAHAVARLVRLSAGGSRVAAFGRLEVSRSPGLVAAAVEALAHLGDPPDLHAWRAAIDAVRGNPRREVLLALGRAGAGLPSTHADLAVAAILTFPPGDGIESALLALLPRATGMRTGAIAWLARRGTPAALPVLDELAARDLAVDAVARAVGAIRARCGSAGGLSIASPVGGELAAAEPDPVRGAVSEARPDVSGRASP